MKSHGVYEPGGAVQGWLSGLKREESRKESPEIRVRDFREVNAGLTLPQAFRESERCMRCYYIAMAAF